MYKARNVLKMCFHPHKTLKNGCNTHRWIELMFQVFVRHSAQLLALIELPDCPKHCFETRCGQDLVKGMCPAFRDEHTSSSPTGMYRCGLGSCHKAGEEREDQGGDGGGRPAGLHRSVLECWAAWGRLCSSQASDPVRPQTHYNGPGRAIWPSEEDLRNVILNLSIALCLKRAFSILLTKVLFENTTSMVYHLSQ